MSNSNDINILLLGETGVGKSTFINGLINYLFFPTFEEAMANECRIAIPSQFFIIDENYEEKLVKIGESDNECHEIGQSSTQNAQVHVFEIEGRKLKVIDTPGIGDTRGIEMDKENFNNTLAYISNFTHLNAVCILLKPNNSKLDLAFRFCIKELLSHLHRSLKDNILFCFTNSKGTFYRPGDTFPALKKLLENLEQNSGVSIPLSKENIYCFDNDSFRFLAALKSGIKFSENEKEQYANSWKHSVETTSKMIEFIKNCPIHDVSETVSLNEARRLISELSKPIADISQNIQENIKLIENKQKEFENTNLSVEQLNERLLIPQKDFKPISLEYPRTVCASVSCINIVSSNLDDRVVEYKTVCHDKCGVKTEVNIVGKQALQRCQAFKKTKGICRNCGCSWTQHIHINYTYKTEIVNLVDENVQYAIENKKDSLKRIKHFQQICEKRKTELQTEQSEIIKISAKLAKFLQQNAITPYNDDLIAYIDLLIKDEEKSENKAVLNGLNNLKKAYEEEKKIFEKGANCEDNQVRIDEIPDLLTRLFDLKHNGKKLQEIVEKIQICKQRLISAKESIHNIRKDSQIVQNLVKFWNNLDTTIKQKDYKKKIKRIFSHE